MSDRDPKSVLLTVPEVAVRIRRHPVAVYNSLRNGDLPLPTVRIGRSVRVTEAALLAFIEDHTQAAHAG